MVGMEVLVEPFVRVHCSVEPVLPCVEDEDCGREAESREKHECDAAGCFVGYFERQESMYFIKRYLWIVVDFCIESL